MPRGRAGRSAIVGRAMSNASAERTARAPDAAGAPSRRAVLGRAAAVLAALTGASGCKKKPLVCEGLPGLTHDELLLRKTLLYVDVAPTPDKACLGCALFVAPLHADTCGGCKILHGAIHPNGTCKIFVHKPEGGAPA
jgi:hypothetical protein